jgi:hypothetical protein
MTANPAKLSGKNPAPPPRSVRVFSPAEIKTLCGELDTRGAAAVTFAAATGLRPAEWAHVERQAGYSSSLGWVSSLGMFSTRTWAFRVTSRRP